MRKTILILLFALLNILSARAQFKVDGIYYGWGSIQDLDTIYQGVFVTSGSPKYSGSVDIPATVTYGGETYEVLAIWEGAFKNCSGLTSVTIPESVSFIGDSAFYGCRSLTSVTIPESVSDIGDYAFYGCTSISGPLYNSKIFAYLPTSYSGEYTIPSGIQSIAGGAFYGCRGLTSVTIPNSVTKIWSNAFSDCRGLTSVTIPNSVTKIGSNAFSDCRGLTSVTIPEGVSYIGESAFEDCRGLTSVTIPESVDTIGTGAFYGTSISAPLYNSKIFAYLPKNHSGEYAIPSGIQLIAGGAFAGCTGLTSVTIPNSVTSIEYCAFYNCSGLTSVTIPNSVTSIGKYAFQNCGLTSVAIGERVTSIGMYAFSKCTGLTSVTIPESVTTIGRYAFWDCTGLTSVEWNARHCRDFDYSYYRSSPFDTSLISITFGDKVEHIPAYLCYVQDGLTSVTIPNSVTSIGDDAFGGCRGLTSVTIGEGVTSIGNYAFSVCSGLTSVTIPNSVTSIGYQAFYGCSGLTSVEWNAVACQDFSSSNLPFPNGENITSITFGKQVERIPAYLCFGQNGLTSVTIPNSVTSIGSSAFSGCSDLTSVTIGKRVDSIGKDAFYGCNRILSVTSLSKTPPRCGDPVFSFYEGTLFVPRGCRIAYLTAQEWYKFSRIEELTSAGTATVTVRPNDASMGTVVGGGEYELDEQVTLVAIPNEGHHFVKWDDGKAANPRLLTVTEDTTIIAIFAKDGDNPTANETSEADNFCVYAQNRTIHLSEDRGLVQVYNMAGQCVYNGHATAIPVPQSGVYIVAVGQQRFKVPVR